MKKISLAFVCLLFSVSAFANNSCASLFVAKKPLSLDQVELKVEQGLDFADYNKFQELKNISDMYIDIATEGPDAYIGRSIVIGRNFLINGERYLAERAEGKFTFYPTIFRGNSIYLFYELRDYPFVEKYLVIEHNKDYDSFFIHRLEKPFFDWQTFKYTNRATVK